MRTRRRKPALRASGIHRGKFVDPWDWRRGERLVGTDTFAAVTTSDALDAGAFVDRLLAGSDTIVRGQWLEYGMFVMTDGVGGQAGSVAVSFGSSLTNYGVNPAAGMAVCRHETRPERASASNA